MSAKDKHRINLLKFLGDPENDFPTQRKAYASLLRIKVSTMYGHFTPDDFQSIEDDAYELRKKNSAKQRAVVLKSLYEEAKGGCVPAIKEFFDRTEGKVKEKVDLGIDVATLNLLLSQFPPEYAEAVKAALVAQE